MATRSIPFSKHRWWDLPAALLLIAAALTAAVRLAATNWTEDLAMIQIISVSGLLLGLALGQSIFSRRVVVLFAIAYGMVIIPWQLGVTLGPGILWDERLTSVLGRLSVSGLQLLQRKPVNDPLLFVALMALLFWILSVQAGYMLTRFAHPWLATLPIGLALFIIHIHDPYWPFRTWFLATYIFFSLLLLARVTYLQRHARWQHNHTRLPPYLGLDLIRVTLLATAVLVLLAWTAPAMASSVPLAERAWREISRPWTVARSRMSNAFASLRASVGLVYDYYGDTLPLGRGNNLTDDVILAVRADSRPENVRRFYWRARVYDTYADGLWTGNFDDSISLTPQNFDISLPLEEGRAATNFQITPLVPLSTLFTVPQPEWISRSVRADIVENPDGTVDIGAIHADINVQAGEVYHIRSAVSAVTESELRQAGTAYPDWVTERYLQLPPTVSGRTQALAERIARGHDNPYDIAVAVTNYLRNNIRYTDTVPVPPIDQDPVDWVLFDLQQGFCNYYATAEIVLLRAVGIPARWAVGYAQGEFDIENNAYIVRQREAHSWPEVYFPGYGWVEFEPTLSQPALYRPEGELENEEEAELGGPINPDASPGLDEGLDELLGLERAQDVEALGEGGGASNPLTSIVLVVAAAGLIGLSLFAWRRRPARARRPIPDVIEKGFLRVGISPPEFLRRWAYFSRLSPMARSYNEVNNALRRLGASPDPNQTPLERGNKLSALLPSAGSSTNTLVSEYQTLTYSQHTADLKTAQKASRTVRNHSWLARLNRLFSRFQESPKRRPNRPRS